MSNIRITDVVMDTIHRRSIANSKSYKSAGKIRTEVWPSQTSISINGAVGGSCLRNLYYKMMGIKGSDPDRAMIPKWERGTYIEQWYQDALNSDKYIDEAGYDFNFVASNIKFKDLEHKVSGEFDGIGIFNGEPIGIEFKTIGAFWIGVQETIKGSKNKPPTAKDTAMLQVMRYLHWTQDKYITVNTITIHCTNCNGTGTYEDYENEIICKCELCDEGSISKQHALECNPEDPGAMQIKKWRILYWMSGEEFGEYEIELGPNGELITHYWDYYGNKKCRVFPDVTIDRILERQEELFHYMSDMKLPPKDYEVKYLEKYEVINRISAINRKVGACGRRKGITAPSECSPEKVAEDTAYLKELKAALVIEQKSLRKAFDNWLATHWTIHPPKYESWSDSKKHVGHWRCRENICSYRALCDKDWNIPNVKATMTDGDTDG